MQTHVRAGGAPRRTPPAPPPQPPEPGAGLLDSLGSIEDEDHILVIGKDGPDLMCALLRAGATRVTHLCSRERPEPDSASLAIVPHLPSLDWLASALPSIRRALHPNGRLVLSVTIQPITQHAIRHMLALHGFAAIRARRIARRIAGGPVGSPLGSHVFSAELPAFGLRRCA